MDDSGKLMDLDSSKKHYKKNNRFQLSARTVKPGRSAKFEQTTKSEQTANSKRTKNSKHIAKLVWTTKSKWSAKFKQATRPKQAAKLGQTDQLALSEQIARITEMESLFTQCEATVRLLSQALENKASIDPDLAVLSDFKDLTSAISALNSPSSSSDLKYLTPNFSPQNSLAQSSDLKDLTSVLATLRSAITILEAYYTSPAWRTDFEADEAGLLPPDLKRGVLSEDGIYNLLEEYKRVEEEMKEMMEEN